MSLSCLKIILQISSFMGAKHIMTSVTSSFLQKLFYSSINLSALNIWKLFLKFSFSMSRSAQALAPNPVLFHKQPCFVFLYFLCTYISFSSIYVSCVMGLGGVQQDACTRHTTNQITRFVIILALFLIIQKKRIRILA